MMFHSAIEGEFPVPFFQFRQMTVLLAPQDLVQVSQGGDGRHQLHMKLTAVSIQFQNIPCRQGGIIPPGFADAIKEEAVLNIQMQLIQFVEGALIRQGLQVLQGRNSSPGHIIEQASGFQIRSILDLQAGNPAAILPQQLPQGLYTPEKSPFTAAGNGNACFCNRQSIALLCQICIHSKQYTGMGAPAPAILHQRKSGLGFNFLPQQLCSIQCRAAGCQCDSVVVPKAKKSTGFFQELRHGYQIHR